MHDSEGDFNLDNRIDSADHTLWRATIGQVGDDVAAYGNLNGVVDAADYTVWRNRYPSIVVLNPGAGTVIAKSTSFQAMPETSDPAGAGEAEVRDLLLSRGSGLSSRFIPPKAILPLCFPNISWAIGPWRE